MFDRRLIHFDQTESYSIIRNEIRSPINPTDINQLPLSYEDFYTSNHNVSSEDDDCDFLDEDPSPAEDLVEKKLTKLVQKFIVEQNLHELFGNLPDQFDGAASGFDANKEYSGKKTLPSKAREPQDNGTRINTAKKVGRNDPCPCGSGKKYKKCCM